jgi:hypothetical protein
MSLRSSYKDALESVTLAHIDKPEADNDLELRNSEADKMHSDIKRCLSNFLSSWKPKSSMTERRIRKLSENQIRSLIKTFLFENNLSQEAKLKEEEEVERLADAVIALTIRKSFGTKQVKGINQKNIDSERKALVKDILSFLSTDGYHSQ